MQISSESIITVTVAFVGLIGTVFGYLLSRVKDVQVDVDKRDVMLREYIKDVHMGATLKTRCEDRQEIWQTRFEDMQEQSRLDHKIIEDKLFELSEELKDISTCLRKVLTNQKCD